MICLCTTCVDLPSSLIPLLSRIFNQLRTWKRKVGGDSEERFPELRKDILRPRATSPPWSGGPKIPHTINQPRHIHCHPSASTLIDCSVGIWGRRWGVSWPNWYVTPSALQHRHRHGFAPQPFPPIQTIDYCSFFRKAGIFIIHPQSPNWITQPSIAWGWQQQFHTVTVTVIILWV